MIQQPDLQGEEEDESNSKFIKDIKSLATTNSSIIMEPDPFDLENSQMVSSEVGIDQLLKLKEDAIDQFVMINASLDLVHDTSFYDGVISIKPVAIYNKYLGYETVLEPTKHTVTYYKGYIPKGHWVSSIIHASDNVNQVTNKFKYNGEEIPNETQVQKIVDLKEAGTYMFFQTLIKYGVRQVIDGTLSGFIVVTVYRDDVFATPIDKVKYEPPNYYECLNYLHGKGISRWNEL
ncbi:hypothetical protein DFA_12350 [Cavenderia fasciculata]|uniref:Monalysin Pore-forming domain-containing protein n=1 Tax=Cavenderia fasciculata TaxID=261658 RepID=F4QDF5_CACFS|nr:uncharacterized protein DFA_12350 [Cavenderia fasciculata]EGG14573.1 hypothetical protein DFA_12350 [Cavenderia fasciculata]|eukprot:XP_004366093.1 hypothetical protein DFA_12350 [Cavenderia fasciculata]